MRAWLFVLAVLATFNRVQQVASTEEVKSSSSSISSYTSSSDSSSLDSNNVDLSDSIERDNHRGNKPDPQTLVQIEKNLLSLFGFEKRPKVDRSKIVIPEAMKQLYAQIMGHELDSLDVPKADLHNKDANTIRSYTHEGELKSLFGTMKIFPFDDRTPAHKSVSRFLWKRGKTLKSITMCASKLSMFRRRNFPRLSTFFHPQLESAAKLCACWRNYWFTGKSRSWGRKAEKKTSKSRASRRFVTCNFRSSSSVYTSRGAIFIVF